MTRALTAAALERAGAPAAAPVNILKLDLEGEFGARYYSDRPLGTGDGLSALNAQGRVVSWGILRTAMTEGAPAGIGDGSIELADADGALRALFRQVEMQRKRVALYQHFDGLGESDLVPLMTGVVDAPVEWIEARGVLRFDITDASTRHRATVGRIADRATFPLVARRDEDAVLPLVFGRVRRSPAVHACSGADTVLVRACSDSDDKLYVENASGFPQDQTLRIRIDRELIEGQFSGNTFNVSARGLDLLTGLVTTRAATQLHIEDSALTGAENEYVGHFIRVQDLGGTTHHRPIWYYSAETHRLCYNPAIIYNNALWIIPAGTAYDITTWARAHQAGAAVYLVQDAFTYIINDAPAKKLRQLFGCGRVFDEHNFEDGQKNLLDVEGWVPIDPNLYTVNLNDSTSFASLGRAVATVTFKMNPKEYYPRLRDNRLWADIEGIEDTGDATGSLIENPAEVIRFLLLNQAGLSSEELDADSFDAVAAGLAGFRMSFTLNRQWDALRLCADLAFQSRSALLWEDGQVRLRLLKNKLDAASLTLDATKIEEGSVRIGRAELSSVVSEVLAHFGNEEERAAIALRDSAVEAAYGRRVRQIELWAYDDRRMAVSIAAFWLERWKRLYEQVRLSVFLPALPLQRADAVTLNLPALFAAGQKGEVREIRHQPGHGERAEMDRITLDLRLPVEAGCSSTCETACESGGESGCLLACEIAVEDACWQCESQCETLCELACTTEAELHCIVSDTDGGSLGGCSACETGCESGCETQCETVCETACQVVCEAACETGCEVTCETGCEVTCETGCETLCESACETNCELTCETLCESTCETHCELTCESYCESACESHCELQCESECQLVCEATGCELGCEISCEICETHCELACETGCETGCETSCETGCETACQTGCETSCETGCEAACQTGCETACETGCETSVECGGSDSFERSDASTVGNGWAQGVNYLYSSDACFGTPAHISSNTCLLGSDNALDGLVPPFAACSADHQVRVYVAIGGSSRMDVCLRRTPASNTHYGFSWHGAVGRGIYKQNGQTRTWLVENIGDGGTGNKTAYVSGSTLSHHAGQSITNSDITNGIGVAVNLRSYSPYSVFIDNFILEDAP